MLSSMREKFGPVFIGLIIGFIAFVFVFYGVFNPRSTRGRHSGAVAGMVNGESISVSEFSREYNRRMEFFKNLGGGKLSEAQLKNFKIKDMVFNDLVNRKLVAQSAQKSGLTASDEEVRETIRNMNVFQKDGKFDPVAYRQVLEANRYSPATFEKMVRDDLSLQQWSGYFKARIRVSDEEVKREFLASSNKRDIKYVLITPEAGKKAIQVKPENVTKFLQDPAKVNLAKSQFERKKDRDFKGLTFDLAKERIAQELLADEKIDEIRKVNETLADRVLGLLNADKKSDAKVNAVLKPYGIAVKSTGMISSKNSFIPGVGEAHDLMADAFAQKSPIDPKQGGKAKKYSSAAWLLVAVVTGSESPDLSQLEADRAKMIEQVSLRKERALYEAWMEKLHAKAKIEKNKSIVDDADEGVVDTTTDG